MNLGLLSFHPSIHPPVLLLSFLGISPLVFSETWMALEAHEELCLTEPDILGKVPFG